MAVQKLQYYLEDFSRLDEISVDALRAWVKKEPYCQNLHVLLAKKLQSVDDTQDLGPFHTAATYTQDRRKLYALLSEKESSKEEASILKEQESEVSEDSVIQEDPVKHSAEANESSNITLKPSESDLRVDGEALSFKEVPNKSVKNKNKKKKKGKKTKAKKKKDKTGSKENKKSSGKRKKSEKPENKKNKKKSGKKKSQNHSTEDSGLGYRTETNDLSVFNQWLLDLRTEGGKYDVPYRDLRKEKKKKSLKKKEKKKKKHLERVVKSVRRSDDIVSQSLAELLVKQGKHKKAIKMYKRLSLIIPEKSGFFASQIEKLGK